MSLVWLCDTVAHGTLPRELPLPFFTEDGVTAECDGHRVSIVRDGHNPERRANTFVESGTKWEKNVNEADVTADAKQSGWKLNIFANAPPFELNDELMVVSTEEGLEHLYGTVLQSLRFGSKEIAGEKALKLLTDRVLSLKVEAVFQRPLF
jgi:hypothetical protein